MSIKVTIDTATNKIINYVPVTTKEVIVEWLSVEDTIVICETTWDICRLQDSSQWKARIKELIDKKWKSDLEKSELEFLQKETSYEKSTDQKEAQEILLSGQYIVNITNKGKKKIATIHDAQTASADGIEFDTERGDINTSDLKIAEEYKRLVEEESLEAAMDYFKSL